jgi:hypothetical protein
MTADIGWGERKLGIYHDPNRIARPPAMSLHTVMPVNGRLWSGVGSPARRCTKLMNTPHLIQ